MVRALVALAAGEQPADAADAAPTPAPASARQQPLAMDAAAVGEVAGCLLRCLCDLMGAAEEGRMFGGGTRTRDANRNERAELDAVMLECLVGVAHTQPTAGRLLAPALRVASACAVACAGGGGRQAGAAAAGQALPAVPNGVLHLQGRSLLQAHPWVTG
jgi:hypothetical protein